MRGGIGLFILFFIALNFLIYHYLIDVTAFKTLFHNLEEYNSPVPPEFLAPSRETGDGTVIADNLEVPWDFVFLPDGGILLTERKGTVLHINDGEKRVIHTVSAQRGGEGGLHGIALHPDFTTNAHLYLYYTYRAEGENTTFNRVERYRYDGGLTERTVLLERIPGAKYHDGGRIAFGPDGHLYITTGDAGKRDLAPDTASLAGKILRVQGDGGIPEDNPFPGSPVYSYGHRNPQGITWDAEGNLWSTEHGRSGLRSGLDELNLIRPGADYGWPQSQGDTALEGTVGPKLHSADVTWAPASAAYHDNRIYFGGLRGEAIYMAVLDGETVVSLEKPYTGFGRIRTVKTGPDGMLYFTTSNRDGRGLVRTGDDVLMRVPIPSAE